MYVYGSYYISKLRSSYCWEWVFVEKQVCIFTKYQSILNMDTSKIFISISYYIKELIPIHPLLCPLTSCCLDPLCNPDTFSLKISCLPFKRFIHHCVSLRHIFYHETWCCWPNPMANLWWASCSDQESLLS